MKLLSVSKILFEDFLGIDGLDIHWYGVLIATGFLLAFFLTNFFCKKRGYKKDLTADMLIICIIGAILGARLYYVIFSWSHFYVPGDFGETFMNIINIRQGGLAIYGGIIGSIIGLSIYAFVKKINLLALLDVCAPSLALGQAIGRWGNFFNQEAHGSLVTDPDLQFFPYAVYLDNPAEKDIPVGWYQATFFYESIWCLIICVTLFFIFRKQKYTGQITLMYLALYGFERGIVEWLRTDQLKVFGMPVSALLSIALCLIATTILIILKVKKVENPLPYYKKGEAPISEQVEATEEVPKEEN